jgi:tRNA 2-thiouridine synthesizing protein C
MADVKAAEIDSGVRKKLMFVNRKAPYGTIYALEALEVVLISAAFEQDVSLAFLDDGVYQLMRGQNTAGIGMKNFSPTYRALGDYDVTKLYVEKESLEERGLKSADLMEITYEDEDANFAEKSSVRIVSRSELTDIMAQQDVLLNF